MYCCSAVSSVSTGFPLASYSIWLAEFSTGALPPRKLNDPLKPCGVVVLIAVAPRPHAEMEGVRALLHDAGVGHLEVLGKIVLVADRRCRPFVNSLATLMVGIRLPGVSVQLRVN